MGFLQNIASRNAPVRELRDITSAVHCELDKTGPTVSIFRFDPAGSLQSIFK